MRYRAALPLAIIFSILITSLPFSNGAYPDTIVVDAREDVILNEFKERKVSGHSEIDIVSLETFDRVTRVEAYLTMNDDIMDVFGFIYSMSVGGVSIVYDNGTFQVFRDSDQEELDDVDVRVTERQIVAELPKSRLEGEFLINATAQEYILDYGQDLSFENYFDVVEGGETSTISQYQISAEDPTGDVRFSFIDQSAGSAPHLDIARMEIEDVGGSSRITMSLEGDPAGRDLEFMIFLGSDGYRIDGSGAHSLPDANRPINDHQISDIEVTLVLGGDPPSPGEVLRGSSREDLEGGGWLEDSCPDIPFKQLDIFPFGTGETLEMALVIGDDMEGTLTVSSGGYDSSLVSALDKDGSGAIESNEEASVLDAIVLALKDDYPVSIDEEEPDNLGVDADLSSSLEFSLTTSFLLDSLDSIVIGIVPFRTTMPLEEEIFLSVKLTIELPEGYRIVPLTLYPEELGNHMTPDSAKIIFDSEDPVDLDLLSGGISFEVKEDKDEQPQDDEVVYEDVPTWVYVLGILALIAIALIIIRSGKRKSPPGDDL
jgi:hypothetical protein